MWIIAAQGFSLYSRNINTVEREIMKKKDLKKKKSQKKQPAVEDSLYYEGDV